METGEDVLATEEANQGCFSNQRGVVTTEAPGGRDQRSGRKKKLSRKVSFPDDAHLVRALDPIDPWENGRSQVFDYCNFRAIFVPIRGHG